MKPRNIPEPGEDLTAPLDLQAEAHTAGPIPDGEIPPVTAPATDAPPDLIEPVRNQRRYEPHETPDASGQDRVRRTGTDGDALPVIVVGTNTEQRLDRSLVSLQRETVFDPAQDNAGPQADQT